MLLAVQRSLTTETTDMEAKWLHNAHIMYINRKNRFYLMNWIRMRIRPDLDRDRHPGHADPDPIGKSVLPKIL